MPFRSLSSFYPLLITALLLGEVKKKFCQPYNCKKEDFMHGGSNFISFFDVRSLNTIHLDCDIFKNNVNLTQNYFFVEIYFVGSFIFNQTLDVRIFKLLPMRVQVSFFNFKGFDIEMPGQILLVDPESIARSQIEFNFVNMKFDFYYRGHLVDQELCDSDEISKLDIKLFGGEINLAMVLTTFTNLICPFAFRNAQIVSLLAVGVENDLLVHQRMEFMNTNISEDINSYVYALSLLDTYNYELKASSFNQLVYARLREFKRVS